MQNVINMIEPGVFTASIDLKDAFFSVAIYENHQNILSFFVKDYDKRFCTPNRYGPALGIFTKITKIPFAHLRRKDHVKNAATCKV